MDIEPGTYVVAVSGGVDSMALLDLMQKHPGAQLVVAHFDHGIRDDSEEDRRLVRDAAQRYNLPFVYDAGKLGPNVSEDVARQARYDFLHRVRTASGARAIVTAHHQDDLLETAVHNMLRGTGRRGLTALRSREHTYRPLLHKSKAELVAYARSQGLVWREDSTNTDLRYSRNYIRHRLLPKFTDNQKQELLQHIRAIQAHDSELETHLINYLHVQPARSKLNRHQFIMLPHGVAREIIAAWLRQHGVQELTSSMVERLIVAAKTFPPGKRTQVNRGYVLYIEKDVLALLSGDR
jgi:tRNA(Ile)-lysidine synthetase-like protein